MVIWLKRILLILLAAGLLVACSTTIKVFDNRNEIESQLSGTILLFMIFFSGKTSRFNIYFQ